MGTANQYIYATFTRFLNKLFNEFFFSIIDELIVRYSVDTQYFSHGLVLINDIAVTDKPNMLIFTDTAHGF